MTAVQTFRHKQIIKYHQAQEEIGSDTIEKLVTKEIRVGYVATEDDEQTKWTIEVSQKVLKTGKNVGDDLREKYN